MGFFNLYSVEICASNVQMVQYDSHAILNPDWIKVIRSVLEETDHYGRKKKKRVGR